MALADTPLTTFLSDVVVPYEDDEVTRLIVDDHDAKAFAPIAHLTVGDFRDWLLSDAAERAVAARARARAHAGDGRRRLQDLRMQDLILGRRRNAAW